MRHKYPIVPLLSTVVVASIFGPSPAVAADPPPILEVVARYDAVALQTPESIATDPVGNVYVSLALTGELSRIDAVGNVETLAVLPIEVPLEPCFGFLSGQTGLVYTPWGLYVNVNSCDIDTRGMWRVSLSTGNATRIAILPPEVFANGLAHRFGQLYASDSFSGRILRAPVWGGEAEVWVEDPLLDPAPSGFGPLGANGVQFYEDELYVANSWTGAIVAFEIEPDQSAGASRVHATLDHPCDDFAFDRCGTMYCGTNYHDSIVAIHPDGETEVVLSGGDFLDGPTAAAFGRAEDRHTLYISNASFPFFANRGSPSVVAVELDVPGYLFR